MADCVTMLTIFGPDTDTVNARIAREDVPRADSAAVHFCLAMPTRDVLLQAVRARIDRPTAEWLERALERAAAGRLPELLEIYTTASTRLGSAPLALAAMQNDGAAFLFGHWTLEDAGRLVVLLDRFAAMPSSNAFADAIACYEQGDTREQRSWLRGIALLPDPAAFLPVVIDACRTSIVPLFEAVACENPYPAAQFPERNFNQLVLKALFNGIALSRIMGLAERGNSELARMAADYAAERRAAGRSVPEDIGLAMQVTPVRRTPS